MKRPRVTKGSSNIFRELGFSEGKSAELMLKSSLLQSIQVTIRDRGWKQVEAASQLGIDQAKVSKLMTGQMAEFSIERLVHLLLKLGQDIEVRVHRPRQAGRSGRVIAHTSNLVQDLIGSVRGGSPALSMKTGQRFRKALRTRRRRS